MGLRLALVRVSTGEGGYMLPFRQAPIPSGGHVPPLRHLDVNVGVAVCRNGRRSLVRVRVEKHLIETIQVSEAYKSGPRL